MNKKGRGKSMVSGGDVIGAYQRIEARTSRMAALAGEKDWESLISHEQDYVMSMADLAEMEADVELDDAQRRQKEQMLQRILAHNAATRRCLTERRDEIAGLMASTRRGSELDRAYGGRSGIMARRPPRGRKSDS